MFITRSRSHLLALLVGFPFGPAFGQNVLDVRIPGDGEEAYWSDTLMSEEELPDPYAPLNAALGGDSVRYQNGVACSGRVEDFYRDGGIRHRGYYGEGKLLVYSNYHPNGQVEREFRAPGSTRSIMRVFFASGRLRSETGFVNGVARTFTEYYANGTVRYAEEKHGSQPYYKVMDLFAPDGKAISTLHLVDKKRVLFEQHEYWPNGQLRASGRSQFNPHRYDSQRIGAWTYFDASGKAVMEERYVDGKIHETAELR